MPTMGGHAKMPPAWRRCLAWARFASYPMMSMVRIRYFWRAGALDGKINVVIGDWDAVRDQAVAIRNEVLVHEQNVHPEEELDAEDRSEGRRVGTEWVRTCRSEGAHE